jgi:hypothetical protein
MTYVLNLDSGSRMVFSLPPAHAVVAAFEHDRGNHNWWTWKAPEDHPSFRQGRASVACGDWTALTT